MKPAAVVVAFVAGALFAVGLVFAGMTQPAKVIAFLDVGGAWDPTLAFVMAGAIAVHMAGLRLIGGRAAPLLGGSFAAPSRSDLDARLLLGAVLFGVGWGLAGYCPGPALVSLGSGADSVLVFAAALTVGMIVQRLATPPAVSP